MASIDSPKSVSRPVWFGLLAYVFLLAFRDVAIERYLSKDSGELSSLSVSFYMCALLFGTSLLLLLVKGQFGELAAKIHRSKAYGWCLLSGVLTTVIYGTTVHMVRQENLGATIFNFLDFGLAPLCIAGIGILLDKESVARELPISIALYLAGMVAMNWSGFMESPRPGYSFLLAVALLSPVATGFSDFLSRRFLKVNGFNQLEVLAIRFSFPTIGIGCHLVAEGQSLTPHNIAVASGITWLLALLPLYILYSVLAKIDLPYLSIWEMLIPAIIFAEAFARDSKFREPKAVVGALLILLGYLVYDQKLLTRKEADSLQLKE